MSNPEEILENHPSREFLELIINYADEIYKELGSGFSESVYQEAFEVILRENSIPFEAQTNIPIYFRNYQVGSIRSDLILKRPRDFSRFFVIELKATVTKPKRPEETQLKNYLKWLNIKLGIIINFPQSSTKEDEKQKKSFLVDFIIIDH